MSAPLRRALVGAAIVVATAIPDLLLASPSALRLGLVACVAATVAVVLGVPRLADRFESALTRRRAIVTVVALWVLAGFAITWLRLQAFQDANGRDLAYHCQVLWNSAHGRFGEGTILQALYFDPPLRNHMGLHVSPTFLALVPLYAVLPGQATLLVVKVLAAASAAVPLYLIARRALGAAAACLVSTAYLLHPTILEQTRHEFYPIVLAAPLLLWAWWAWERRRFRAFIVCAVLFVGVREDLALMLAAFAGVWAIEWWSAWRATRRGAETEPTRPIRWALVPAIVGTVWFVLATKLVMPAFGGGAVAGNVMKWYSGFGDHPDDITRTLLTDPIFVLGTLLVSAKALYVWHLARPFLFAPLAGRAALLAIPALAINLLVTGDHPTIAVTAHYSVAIVAALAAATVGALGSLSSRRGPASAFRVALVICAVAVSAITDTYHGAARQALTRPPHAETIERALALVPPHASVAAPNAFLAHVADAEVVYDSEQVGHYPAFETDVVILELDASRSTLDVRDDAGLRAREARFRSHPGYRVALEEHGIVVFVRR